jgi:hypothetical protein
VAGFDSRQGTEVTNMPMTLHMINGPLDGTKLPTPPRLRLGDVIKVHRWCDDEETVHHYWVLHRHPRRFRRALWCAFEGAGVGSDD